MPIYLHFSAEVARRDAAIALAFRQTRPRRSLETLAKTRSNLRAESCWHFPSEATPGAQPRTLPKPCNHSAAEVTLRQSEGSRFVVLPTSAWTFLPKVCDVSEN